MMIRGKAHKIIQPQVTLDHIYMYLNAEEFGFPKELPKLYVTRELPIYLMWKLKKNNIVFSKSSKEVVEHYFKIFGKN